MLGSVLHHAYITLFQKYLCNFWLFFTLRATGYGSKHRPQQKMFMYKLGFRNLNLFTNCFTTLLSTERYVLKQGKLNTLEVKGHVQRKVYKHKIQIRWWSWEHTTWSPFPSLHTELFQKQKTSCSLFTKCQWQDLKIFHHLSQGWSSWNNTEQWKTHC